MVDQALDDDFGIDAETYVQQQDQAFEDDFIDAEEYVATEPEIKQLSFLDKIADIGTQAGRGALKAFTWPLDVLKMGMIGEGLNAIDEVEEFYQKEGKPFDRQKYVKNLFEQAEYVPTQDLAEKSFSGLTGISLEPKTGAGEFVKQASEIASLTKGGFVSKLSRGVVGAGATTALESMGVGKDTAQIAGDVIGMAPSFKGKVTRKLGEEAASLEKTASKHALPFIEAMAREKSPLIKGRISEATEKRLNKELKMTSREAISALEKGEFPLKRLQEKGYNIDALAENAYKKTTELAQANPGPIDTKPIAENFQKEIDRIKSLAPSPSDAQREAIKILERERDIFKVSNPTAEQLVQQHKNYNADMKQIYRKPEFSGKEEQVRKTYEFMKQDLVDAMESQGHKETANAFREANKIYHEKSRIEQTENLLNKVFEGDRYDPKKLDKFLNSKKGNFLKRNMSSKAIDEIQEIADYGRKAEERIAEFMQIDNKNVQSIMQSLGKLAPFILAPHTLVGAALSSVQPLAMSIQGKLLTRPVAREVYKLTMKHAAEGAFDLLKKDMVTLENVLIREFGSVDDFIDDAWFDQVQE